MDTLTGSLGRIVFQKDGFLIARLESGVTVKGSMVNPQTCVEYTFSGDWVNDPRWGKQFNFKTFSANLPQEGDAIAKYLRDNCKHVGPATAQAIVDAFGPESLTVLKTNPELVADRVNGLTLARAVEVSAMLRANEDEEKMTIALNEILMGTGISKGAFERIIKTWGANAPDVIRENPFCLTRVHGVGFLMADKVRSKLGIPNEDPNRIRAGIVFTLEEAAWNAGHTYLPDSVFFHGNSRIKGCCNILGLAEDVIAQQVKAMEAEGDLTLS